MKTYTPDQMRILLFIALAMLLTQCSRAQKSHFSKDIRKEWETPSLFQIPESVKYDDERDVIYISNINGNPAQKDTNGFISKISSDGIILDLHWVDGLNAPKGMGILGNSLFVTDLTELVEINITSAEIIARYPLNGASFLNDIDIDENGALYISDSKENKIYRFSGGKARVFLEGPDFEFCNGLYADGNSLYVGTKGKIWKANLKTSTYEIFIPDSGPVDGLEMLNPGYFLFSDWTGSVFSIEPGPPSKLNKLIDTSPEKINAADIEFLPQKKMILVPTFQDNRVMAYTLK